MSGSIASFALGAFLLMLGADALLRGLSGLGLRSGAGSYAVGLIATALGGLLPVLAITLCAVLLGEPQLALGAALGGAIAQYALVLGVCALVAPLRARLRMFRWLPLAVALALLVTWLLSADGQLGALDGSAMLLAYAVIAVFVIIHSRREPAEVRNELVAASSTSMLVWRDAARVVAGAVMVPFAALLLVAATLDIGARSGISPLILGLTALGGAVALASLGPNLLAARRGQGDFVIGHAFGAVLAHVLLLPGLFVLWQPLFIGRSLTWVEIPLLLVLALMLYPMMRSGSELSRREGSLLILIWLLFLAGQAWLALR